MLAIKLKRIGKKHQAFFRVIVSEKRSKLDGKYVEDLGFLNPHTNQFKINKERVEYWLKNGAQATDTVHNILVKAKIVEGPKIPVHKKSKKPEAVNPPAGGEQPATEQPAPAAEQPAQPQSIETPTT